MRFVWHELSESPCPSAPLIIKTNHMCYHVGLRDTEGRWWVRTGKRYSELEKVVSGSEKVTSWAYIGGES